MDVKEKISLLINGKQYSVPDDLPGNTSLNTFIRDYANLKGTKFMCLEGGCGACIVETRFKHSGTGKHVSQAVNSCLVPVFSCQGWSITTIEGIGDKKKGYHYIQKRLVKTSGTQCGYCSPGMVMNMYSLIRNNPNLTMLEVENSFGGSLCRCTGYRPILDAFKSLAHDAPKELVKKCADIEDLTKTCPKTGQKCNNSCHSENENEHVLMATFPKTKKYELRDGSTWYHVTNKKEIFEILDMAGDNNYMIVGGNTAHGVYRVTELMATYIDIGAVAELHFIDKTSNNIILGANVSLTDAMAYFNNEALDKNSPFAYTKVLADHIDLIANVPVRNAGTLAGNLSIKHKNQEFPSDIFLMLETVGAQLVIEDNTSTEETITLQQYLGMDMNKKLLTKILLPAIDMKTHVLKTYKIMPRAQNAHAYVNAGFLCRVNKADKFKVLETPSIVIGGINPRFIHALHTESFLVGKSLLQDETLKDALKVLNDELNPDHILPDTTPEFRRGLALSLFYKFLLSLSPGDVDSRNRSGGVLLNRPVSSSKQDYDTDPKVWPLNKPIPKIEAYYQCSGEAEYVNDIPTRPDELHGAFVLAKRATASDFTVNATEALKIPGVVAFFTAKDIPGKNNFTPAGVGLSDEEELFASGKIQCAGKAVGLIVADTHAKALYAASKVVIEYKGLVKPTLDVRKIISSGDPQRIYSLGKKDAKQVKTNVKHKIQGRFDIKSQYHFTMETQTCMCIPLEDGIDVYASTQWTSLTQLAVSNVLNLPVNRVNVQVRRIGGGYGSKLTRVCQIATACALASYLLQKPTRIVLNLETNMEMVGRRFPCYTDYDVGVDNNGQIQYLNLKFYEDDGISKNDNPTSVTMLHMVNGYDDSSWNVEGFGVKTDTECNSWCRAPGSAEGIGTIENVMEHIANVVKKDPTEVRINNLNDQVLKQLISDIKNSSEYSKREAAIEKFNKENRWKKRGISLVPMSYLFGFWGNFYATVSVFSADGTVGITHGCTEMGQGLNTKVAQVCAYMFGIDVSDVSIKPTMTVTSPNNSPTGGSIGSEAVSYATKICCEQILKRLQKLKQENPTASFKELAKLAGSRFINLSASHMFTAEDDVKSYNIYGTSVIEVEVDVLTGQHMILRADIIEDAGISLSPEVDIGQIEGSYIMGLGYYTSEELVRDDETGQLLTNRTWNYKIPGAKDIPLDFRIQLRKNAPNPVGVLQSKATGEPPLCMSVGVLFAIRNALKSARSDSGLKEDWFDIEVPFTGERIWTGSGTTINQFKLYKNNNNK